MMGSLSLRSSIRWTSSLSSSSSSWTISSSVGADAFSTTYSKTRPAGVAMRDVSKGAPLPT